MNKPLMRKHAKQYSKKIRIAALIISIVSIFFLLFYIKNLLIEVALFLFCLIFMVRFGQFFILDVDPVPFCAILLSYIFDYRLALQFIFFSIPIIDIISSRFNHYSVINFASIAITLLTFGLISQISSSIIYFGIITFNSFRSLFNYLFGLGPQNLAFNFMHAIIYTPIGFFAGYFL